MPCPEIAFYTENPYIEYDEVQQFVSQGFYSWRLDPVETARIVGVYRLGLKPNDRFTFVQAYQESGVPHVTVYADHTGNQPCRYVFSLLQPLRRGAGGIWVVDTVQLR